MIRSAEERDAEALARIYNQAMRPGIFATAAVDPVSREDRLAWLARHRDPFGVWVYETASHDVLGWCSLGVFGVRPCYPGIAEVSAYVDERHRRGRVGSRLLACLVYQARSRGFRSLVSLAFEKNVASISGCLMAGFRPMGLIQDVATVGSALETVSWIQKDLSAEDPPILKAELRRIESQLS